MVKIVIAIFLIKHYTVNMYGAVEVKLHVVNLGRCMEVSGQIMLVLYGRSCYRQPRHRFFLVSLCL